MKRHSRFNGIPADLARKGDCGAAKRAVDRMTPGVAQDYESGRVEELCAIGSGGARLGSRGARGYGAFIVRSAEKSAKSSWTTEIVEKESEALAAARQLSFKKKEAVCVFDSKRWEAKPTCFMKGDKVPYRTAPVSKTTGITRGPPLRRLAIKNGEPIVALDGYRGKIRCGKINVRQLAKGARIEHREHPEFSKKTAKQIARDHLCRNPAAYKKEK
jgi:hypothetical protein